MLPVIAILFFVVGCCSEGGSSKIIFPTIFPNPEKHNVDLFEVKNCYQKGIDAVQNVAGLVQNLLLQETINFAAKNWVISPVSLAGVFAQLLMGSRGEIREILTDVLSLVDDEDYGKLQVHRQLGNLLRYLQHPAGDDYILLLNAVVFLQTGFPLKATYKHALMDFYETKIIPVDFSNPPVTHTIEKKVQRKQFFINKLSLSHQGFIHTDIILKIRGKSMDSLMKINEWVRNSTLGRFSDISPSPLPPNTVSIMANVVYFKGAWELPFDPDYTQPGVFFIDQNRKVHVDYMYGEQQILYGNTSDFQLIGLPFKSREVVIYILLPNGKFSTRVAMKQLDAIASSARLENVTLVLPKFKITTTISVKNSIAKYLKKKPTPTPKFGSWRSSRNFSRLNELEKYAKHPYSFEVPVKDNDFDMSGASDDLRFKIDDILHKVSVQLDEVGTEIVAVTSTLVDHAGNDFIIKVNRPFLFFVRHEFTLTHLFWGLVVNPGKS